MLRRSLFLLPAVLAAAALPAGPAFAGEDDGESASLNAPSRACLSGHRVKATVSGDDIDTVAFYVDGKRLKRVTEPAVTGRFVFAMPCSRLSVGAHRAFARVSFASGDRQTLRFQITRARQASPRFTG